jgi:hypothetical protein
VTKRANVVTSAPKAWETRTKVSIPLAKDAGSKTLELVGKPLGSFGWVTRYKQVNVVRLDFQGFDFYTQFFGLLVKQVLQVLGHLTNQEGTPVLWTPDQVIFQGENTPGVSAIPLVVHPPNLSQVFDTSQASIRVRRCAASPVA